MFAHAGLWLLYASLPCRQAGSASVTYRIPHLPEDPESRVAMSRCDALNTEILLYRRIASQTP